MKVIIAGGRDFNKGDMVINAVNDFKKEYGSITEVVCGMCQGADMMGLNYANFWDIPVKKFYADWKNKGKSAGPIRNKMMSEYADGLIAFWDGNSKGTKNMIELSKMAGLKVKVVNYNND